MLQTEKVVSEWHLLRVSISLPVSQTASVGWSLSGSALDSEHGPSRVFSRAAVHVRRRGNPSMFVSYYASGRTTGIVIDSRDSL